MSNKVVARIIGGIGNQLFIYAAAKRLALANAAEIVLDSVSGFERDHQYRRTFQLDKFNINCRHATDLERMHPFPRIQRYIRKKINSRRDFNSRNYIFQENLDFDERLLHLRFNGSVYLEGYWQSENYFFDIKEKLRSDLIIKTPPGIENHQTSRLIEKKNAVAIHVRFFDRPELTEDSRISNNTQPNYYKLAIEIISREIDNPHFFIFSDDPRSAIQLFKNSTASVTIVDHNVGDSLAYADLWLMSQCKHFIIANSTFSWWGAWLSDKPDAIVIAPGVEKTGGQGSWGFKGLIPKSWRQL
ncbi:alpha-1,2-fucosyltransferase [Hydrogenophaga sp.]|uniref:alpha-1,2-fucosyltransferase n=1 Tax=Hydrogenophaga sp. TaxID=1904254 RepID=UPI0035AFDDEA